jgi:DNA-binding NarL/FixJ family response regulator
MNHPQLLNLILIASASLMVCCAMACLIFLRKARQEAQNCTALTIELESRMAETSRDLDTMTQRATDQARRIAWLESRVRNSSVPAQQPPLVDEALSAQASTKPTITERRHRVMQLKRRGVDCNTIASMLNMPHGEVELMVNLNDIN